MIPNWTSEGVLPPIRPGKSGTDPDRSPYAVSITDFINRFATSAQRNKILCGLLDYRQSLYSIGIHNGFQWLDGSFTEDVETRASRPPNDVDVVTFLVLPNGLTQLDLYNNHANLFEHDQVKKNYWVDSHFLFFNTIFLPYHIKMITYWYSMWSHRRDGNWKGYLQIPLDINEDNNARVLLNSIMAGGSI